MSIDNSITNQDRKKMPHMFQKSNIETTITVNDIDSIPQYQQNLTKIVKSYRSNQDKNLEIRTNTLLSNVKSLIDTQNTDVTKTLYDYLEQLKSLYFSEKIKEEKPIVEEEIQLITQKEFNIEEEIEFIEQEDFISEEEVEEENININIDHILQQSEKEILNLPDQKSVLKSLINDININSSKNTKQATYDEMQFIRNITEIISESKDEEDLFDEDEDEDIQEKRKSKKMNMKWVFIFMILIVIGLAGYLYKDIIMEFVQQNLNL